MAHQLALQLPGLKRLQEQLLPMGTVWRDVIWCCCFFLALSIVILTPFWLNCHLASPVCSICKATSKTSNLSNTNFLATFKAMPKNNYNSAGEKGNISRNPSSQEQESNWLAEVLHSGAWSIGTYWYAVFSIAWMSSLTLHYYSHNGRPLLYRDVTEQCFSHLPVEQEFLIELIYASVSGKQRELLITRISREHIGQHYRTTSVQQGLLIEVCETEHRVRCL